MQIRVLQTIVVHVLTAFTVQQTLLPLPHTIVQKAIIARREVQTRSLVIQDNSQTQPQPALVRFVRPDISAYH